MPSDLRRHLRRCDQVCDIGRDPLCVDQWTDTAGNAHPSRPAYPLRPAATPAQPRPGMRETLRVQLVRPAMRIPGRSTIQSATSDAWTPLTLSTTLVVAGQNRPDVRIRPTSCSPDDVIGHPRRDQLCALSAAGSSAPRLNGGWVAASPRTSPASVGRATGYARRGSLTTMTATPPQPIVWPSGPQFPRATYVLLHPAASNPNSSSATSYACDRLCVNNRA